jgi:hypothetical protein
MMMMMYLGRRQSGTESGCGAGKGSVGYRMEKTEEETTLAPARRA